MSWSKVQSLAAAAVRYFVKLSVVPEESERCTVRIVASGSFAPLLSAVIAGSFHLVTLPPKILARTEGVNVRSVTPETLKTMAIGPGTIGRLTALPVLQRLSAAATSPLSAFSGESEPANDVCPFVKSVMPWPEPTAL